MRESTHEPYCDENHAPRQRCNRALASAGDPIAAFEAKPEPARAQPEIVVENEIVAPPVSSAVREAVAAQAMPSASPWVARALDDRVQALEPPHYLASNEQHAFDVAVDKGNGALTKVLIVAGALAAIGAVALIIRAAPQAADIGPLVEGLVPTGGRNDNGDGDEPSRPADDPKHIYMR
jgi:L-serine deaminase